MNYTEDPSSLVPALLLAANLGYTYIDPDEGLSLRENRLERVILSDVLAKWMQENNAAKYRGSSHAIPVTSIQDAIDELRDIPFNEGEKHASEHVYDLLTLGTTAEISIDGDRKSYSLKFIDWEEPRNNVYHVTNEFSVQREGRTDTYRPDIVLFVNGIPLVVIENKSPKLNNKKGKPVDEAISQHLRNQDIQEGIPRLYAYSQILIAAAGNDAKYATSGTPSKFWAVWKEDIDTDRNRAKYEVELGELKNFKNQALWDKVFTGDYAQMRQSFERLYADKVLATDQDKTLHSLIRTERLIELVYKFLLYDNGDKKVARYQQYFAVQNTLPVIKQFENGKRKGGVVWHTQGSGKSLTMVMLAKSIALDKSIKNPRVIIVTDRIDLDDQIAKTFKNCGKDVKKAKSGKDLQTLLKEKKVEIITTVLGKFEKSHKTGYVEESTEIFVLVDESHRSQYGKANVMMQQVVPNATFIAFTGTPLMKSEKSTVDRFGEYLHKYTIDQAVQDGSVVPLYYEGREVELDVNQKEIDKRFELIARHLNEEQKEALKRKYSRADQINETESRLIQIVVDVADHYNDLLRGTGFKGQLTAPSKRAAVRFKELFSDLTNLTTDVVISGPDTRKDNEESQRDSDEVVQAFWKTQMKVYGTEKRYQDSIISKFKSDGDPDLLIVVDKLLTGFDAPNNRVLYIARSLRQHNLLQAIARVNRLADGKDYGLIVDYYGVLGELDEAMQIYSSLEDFEEDEIRGTITPIKEKIEGLAQTHSELWDLFKAVSNKEDNEAMERHLAEGEIREDFYELTGRFARLLNLAESTLEWTEKTPDSKKRRYRADLKRFMDLRKAVKIRYSDDIDYGAYESQIQKALDAFITAEEVQVRIEPVNINNKEEFEAQLEELSDTRAIADTIASRTNKFIDAHLDKDPAYYRKLSEMLKDVVEEMKSKWEKLTEEGRKLYVDRLKDIKDKALSAGTKDMPKVLNSAASRAIYHSLEARLNTGTGNVSEGVAGEALPKLAKEMEDCIKERVVVDWKRKGDVQSEMRKALDDLVFEFNGYWKVGLSDTDIDQLISDALEVAKRNIL